MNTNELDWMMSLHKQDTVSSMESVEGETIYTLFMADFLKMPDVNYVEVADVEPHLRALLN